MTTFFNDEKYYKEIKKNPLATVERKTRLHIKQIK